jgi:hypothetical protein
MRVPGGPLRSMVAELSGSAAEVRSHITLIASMSAVSVVATLGSPMLLAQPVALIALCPRLMFLSLAAPQVPLPLFLAIGIVRLSVTDPAHYLIGRRVGRPALERIVGHRRVLGRLASGHPAGRVLATVAVLLRPNGMYLALAGAQRVPAPVVAAAVATGTTAYLVAVHTGVGLLFG